MIFFFRSHAIIQFLFTELKHVVEGSRLNVLRSDSRLKDCLITEHSESIYTLQSALVAP